MKKNIKINNQMKSEYQNIRNEYIKSQNCISIWCIGQQYKIVYWHVCVIELRDKTVQLRLSQFNPYWMLHTLKLRLENHFVHVSQM